MQPLRETIPLKKSKIIKKSISGIIGLFIVITFFSIFIALFTMPESSNFSETFQRIIKFFLFGLIPFIIIGSIGPIYQYYYWKRYFYDIDEKNIIIRKGVIAQKEITLPFSRITDIYLDQDLLDVWFGLYDVHISTPTEQSGQFAHIDGVDKEGSVKLRQMILDKINKNNT